MANTPKEISYFSKIRGISHINNDGSKRQVIAKSVGVGEYLILVREPHNPYDRNAIAVFTSHHKQLGYLAAEIASEYAPAVDYGWQMIAVVSSKTGGFFKARGVNIYLIFSPPK